MSICKKLGTLTFVLLAGTCMARAGEVTFERLRNPEPQNWLMNHHDFGAQRYSALDAINKSNVKNLQARLRGRARRQLGQREPDGHAAGRGRLHVHGRRLGRGLQDRRALRHARRHRLEDGSGPGEDRAQPRRRAVGQSRHLGHRPGRPRHRHRQGDRQDRLGQEPARPARHDAQCRAAGAQGFDHRRRLGRRPGRARLGRGARCPRPATCSGGPIRFRRPASPAARPGRTRTMPGRPAAAPSTSPARTIPPPTSPIGAPATRRRNTIPPIGPGDNLYTNSALALDAATGKIKWFHQYTPNDTMDYDETGTHIIIDAKVNGEDRKLLAHAGRNGFYYAFDRLNGQFLKAIQYVDKRDLDQGHRSQDRQAGRLRSATRICRPMPTRSRRS